MGERKSGIQYWWSQLKPSALFLIKLVILLSLLKCIFFLFNRHSGQGWQINTIGNAVRLTGWSLFYDTTIVAFMVLPLAVLFLLVRKSKAGTKFLLLLSSSVFAFMILLNAADIFYYPFKLQRSDAEILYVVRNPFGDVNATYLLVAAAVIVSFFAAAIVMYRWIHSLLRGLPSRVSVFCCMGFYLLIIAACFCGGTRKLLPTYPLVDVAYNQLPLAQNSFHQFLFSLFRKNESVFFSAAYIRDMPDSERLPIIKTNAFAKKTPKNIVLFIMESVPYDFFDSSSKYKVKMPFLDSLVKNSTFFTSAFSYSHNSNKGITAILAGTPTLTEIPLYHSAYTAMPITHLGAALGSRGYASSFFIGDDYDNFGFAKCVNWLGFQRYYCMTDIPGYRDMEKHTMGLHDEYVLHYMQGKVDAMQQPFLAVNFNISTHFPNDLPSHRKDRYPDINRTPHMQTMNYYSDCLADFFKHASRQSWYKNTVFIFCSDHWMYPNFHDLANDVEGNFRIALFVYDPEKKSQTIVRTPVSQLNVINTMLDLGDYQQPFISYGEDLLELPPDSNRIVFAKENNVLYEAFDSSYVLGFNVVLGKPEFFYDYIRDHQRKLNLAGDTANVNLQRLSYKMKCFLHTAYRQYEDKRAN